jgi:hypothetical protein
MNGRSALRRIQAELEQLAADAEHHPADPHQIRVIARKVAAQAEMEEQGLCE